MGEWAYAAGGELPSCLRPESGDANRRLSDDLMEELVAHGFVMLKVSGRNDEPFDLRTGRTVALMAATIAACACVQALVIAPAVAAFYPNVDVALFAASVIGNGIVFPLGFAVPFMILLQEELGFAPIDARTQRRTESLR